MFYLHFGKFNFGIKLYLYFITTGTHRFHVGHSSGILHMNLLSKNRPIGRFFHRVAMSVYVIYFDASHWPLDPEPLIIGPGTTIRATIGALPSAHYHLPYHPRYDPRTTICALPSAVQPDDS